MFVASIYENMHNEYVMLYAYVYNMHYAYFMHHANILKYGWVNFIDNFNWLFAFKWHPTRHNMYLLCYILCVHILCIMQLTYCTIYIVFCTSKFVDDIHWLFHGKWHPTRPNVYLVYFVCIYMSAYFIIMHYAFCT